MNYAEIQTEVANFLNRSDLTIQIKTWINQAMREAERGAVVIDNKEIIINWNHMKKRQTTSSGDVYITNVANMKSIRWLKILRDGQYYDLDKYDADTAMILYPTFGGAKGQPKIYAFMEEQSEIMVRPDPDQSYAYDIGFVQYTANLSGAADINWWTSNAEDVLIYGALIHSAPYIAHDERMAIWEKEYEKRIKKLALVHKDFDAEDRYLVIASNLPAQLRGRSQFDFITGD